MSRDDVFDLAAGKWRGVLPRFGISPKVLDGKHHPCPVCGGKDRFRFTDRSQRGSFICNHCGAGSGVDLVMRMQGWDFSRAAIEVKAELGGVEKEAAKKSRSAADVRSEMRALWDAGNPVRKGDHVDAYLHGRGIDLASFSPSLRSVQHAAHSRGEMHPAMLARMTSADGSKAVNVHRTFLTLDGRKAPVDPVRKLIFGSTLPPGCAIRLAPAAETLGVAEGIETALSASILTGIACWSTIDADLLTKWTPPPEARSIVIFADNDRSFTGQAAAAALAKRLVAAGLMASIEMPPDVGTDWNDVLMTRRVAA